MVRKVDGTLMSWSGDYVDYAVGRTTRPGLGNGPLAAFRELADAKAFTAHYCAEIRATGAIYKCFCCLRNRRLPQNDIGCLALWRGGNRRVLKIYTDSLPPGTILCNSIELLEEIANIEDQA